MKHFVLFVALTVSAWTAQAQLTSVRTVENITEYALPNGLQVLLVPDATKPVVTVNLTYRVGSRHESAGETGSAHLLEHMLFKASGSVDDPKRDMQALGMRWNGTTWFDRTNYFAHFLSNDAQSAQRMDFMLGWLAGMMTQAKFTQADLGREMTVVRNEFERAENEPGRVLSDRMRSVAFSYHGYRHSVLGARTDIENMPLEGLYAFYRKHYRPDNATLIVAGRFDADAVKVKIASAFGAIAKPDKPLPTTYTLDPVQDGERSVMLRRVGGFASTAAMYRMPAGGTRQGVAARLLAETLSQRGGPLARGLVVPQTAVTEYAAYTATREPGFLVAGIGLPEKAEGMTDDQYAINVFSASAALAAVVENYQPSDSEVQVARQTLLANWRALLRDAEATGQTLSEMVAMGDWRLIFGLRDALAAISPQEVRSLASSYLLASNRTAGTYLPIKADVAGSAAKIQRAPAVFTPDISQLVSSDTTLPSQTSDSLAQTVGALSATNAPSDKSSDKSSDKASDAPTDKPSDIVKAENFDLTPDQILLRTQRGQLSVAGAPGLQLAVLPRGSKDNRVVGTLRLRWGNTDSLKGSAVLASMLGSQLVEGTSFTKAADIKARMQALDASLAFFGSAGFLTVNMEFPAANTRPVLVMLNELLRTSLFSDVPFKRLQQTMVSGIESAKSSTTALASHAVDRAFRPKNLYPEGDPRELRTFDEAQAQIRAATATDLKAYWRRFGSARVGELVLLGPVDLANVQAQLQALWSDWTSAEPHAPWANGYSVPASNAAAPLSIVVADKANANYVGRLAVSMNEDDADFPALFTAVQLLSFQSLRERIREKDGLSYGVGANLAVPRLGRDAAIDITASFAPSNLAKLRQAVREVLTDKRESGFGALEVSLAKSAILTRRAEQRVIPANAVAGIANNIRFNLPLDLGAKFDAAYQQLDAAAVNAALKKHLKPKQLWDAAAGSF